MVLDSSWVDIWLHTPLNMSHKQTQMKGIFQLKNVMYIWLCFVFVLFYFLCFVCGGEMVLEICNSFPMSLILVLQNVQRDFKSDSSSGFCC